MMKKLFLFLCCLSAFAFTSCDKKDGSPSDPGSDPTPTSGGPTYYVEYDGTKYEVTKAFCRKESAYGSPDVWLYRLWITSPEVQVDTVFLDHLREIGDGILLSLTVPADATSILANTYPYSQSPLTGLSPNRLYGATIGLSYNFEYLGAKGNAYSATSGSLTVGKAGDMYTINFSGKDRNNKTIKCFYKGTVTTLQSR